MNKIDVDKFGKNNFTEKEIALYGCNPESDFSRSVRRISTLIIPHIEQVVDDLERRFSSTSLRKSSFGRAIDDSVYTYIDQRLVDLAHNISGQYCIKKPFVPIIFTSLTMFANKYSIASETWIMRIIDTHSIFIRYKNGNLCLRDELVRRKLIIGG